MPSEPSDAPQVSVVMSTHDRRPLLTRALASALAQVDVDLEVVVVDNGSTDDTAAHLAAISDPRLVVVRNEVSLGPTGGRNRGLAEARGTWVGVLDDDDLWAPDKLAAQLAELERTGRAWAYTGVVYIDGLGRITGGTPAPTPEAVVRDLPHRYVVPGGMSTMLWRRELFDDPVLDPELRWQCDWDLSLRLLRLGPPAAVRRPLVAYRQHGGQVSRGVRDATDEIARVESRSADLRAGGEPPSRASHHRFLGSEALRAGQRGLAARSYLRAAAAGDLGAMTRLLGLLLPTRLVPAVRARVLGDAGWMAEAAGWLEPDAPGVPHGARVVFLQRSLRRYREPFVAQVGALLAEQGVAFEVVHSNRDLGGPREDASGMDGTHEVEAWTLGVGESRLVWQRAWDRVADADLVVLEQASRNLINLALQARRAIAPGRTRLAIWGHGETLESDANPAGVWLKRALTRHADWWFAYTDASAARFVALGADPDRVTAFQNATDTRGLRAARRAVTGRDVRAARDEVGLGSGPTVLFVGNLGGPKRLDVLLDAVERGRAEVPDLEVVLVGGGALDPALRERIDGVPWAHLPGQRFDADLAALAAGCLCLCVPAWAGLSVVDGFALGLPVVLADDADHPPEAEYVRDGIEGLRVSGGLDPDRLAEALVRLATDPQERARLAAGAAAAGEVRTVEAMAARVVDGILTALARPPARGGRRPAPR
ncbi:MAG: glycosyltransferase [Actinomycetes bacterium]